MHRSLLLASSLAVGSSLALSLYLYWLHDTLHRCTHHTSRSGPLASYSVADRIETVPEAVFSSGLFFSVYDRSWRVVKKKILPEAEKEQEEQQELGNLLTLYLRHNMLQFSQFFPQAWFLRFIAPAGSLSRRSFSSEYIRRLDFQPEDVVCGVYVVKLRTRNKVVFEIRPFTTPASASAAADEKTGGRLVISIQEEGRDEYVFSNETVMWKAVDDESVVLPLERAPLRWMHELASWWLLDSGVRYLRGLSGR